ncbi:hypothetical protein BAY61_02025 [Prauserella marina]|uniref:Uncharacterized protein n=1 Tax=Prauserella marina TaxID=530584 RepID=A0A222VJ76_9PSEU|nr:hypothetical protein [Prauserella marina]ASR33970.1 hypothetical protein BAY61_02025 [Prauserella marina]PWV82581.1 hypothetical protein DES30_102824 [Prauserella marina]SDC72461.1 hypothetical protein SAMN05421630_103360 [Prauserella marina]
MSNAVAVPGYPRPRLHQPWRLVVAFGELVVAAVAVWGAILCWSEVTTLVTVRLNDGTELVSRHIAGNWIGIAIGLVAVAGILVVDAVRHTLLGVRARGRRRHRSRQGGQDAATD